MADTSKGIKTGDLLGILWRTFLIQASWSFDRMQSLGFAYALKPVLKKLYPDREEFLARLALHTEFFNTQPYLASFVLGAVARLEQEQASGRSAAADAAGLKTMLMSPLGALGDSFFWGSLKPLASLAAVAVLMTGVWWAPLVFLLLYNYWHLRVRTGALFTGFHTSGDAGALMGRYQFTKHVKLFKAVSLSLLGGIVGMAPLWREEFRLGLGLPGYGTAVISLLCILVMGVLLRRGGSPLKLMLGLAALSMILAYAGVGGE